MCFELYIIPSYAFEKMHIEGIISAIFYLLINNVFFDSR